MKNKVVVLDYGFYLHTSAYAYIADSSRPASYTCLTMIIGDLKRIGVHPDDIIIIAVDFHGEDYSSWRKLYEPEYKGNRKKLPLELYEQMNYLLEKLNEATNFHIITVNHAEADDIMAVCCRYYKDKEVVLVVSDSDLEQMWEYDNVKIFSPHRLSKRYKIPPQNFNAYRFIQKKVGKEVSDNLVNPLLSEEDFNNRLKCIDLLHLPKNIELPIEAELDELKEKESNIDLLPYPTLRDRFSQIYNKGTEPYEKSVKYIERKKKRLAKKKAMEKALKKGIKK